MKCDQDVDHNSNPEFQKLQADFQKMQTDWQERQRRLEMDDEKGQSVTERYLQLKESFLFSHQGIELNFTFNQTFERATESKSAVFNNSHLQSIETIHTRT